MYQIATPEFGIGAAEADPTMMVSDIGVGIRKGGLLIAGSWNTAATFSATLDVRNLFSGTAAIAPFPAFRSHFLCRIGGR